MNIRYALLLDDLYRNESSKAILEHLNTKPEMDIRIFLLDKENILPNQYPIFNIADYFNFSDGVTIITSELTKQKAESYPIAGLFLVIGKDIPGYINIEQFNLNIIGKIANDHYTNKH